jgi:hypothetical protein
MLLASFLTPMLPESETAVGDQDCLLSLSSFALNPRLDLLVRAMTAIVGVLLECDTKDSSDR